MSETDNNNHNTNNSNQHDNHVDASEEVKAALREQRTTKSYHRNDPFYEPEDMLVPTSYLFDHEVDFNATADPATADQSELLINNRSSGHKPRGSSAHNLRLSYTNARVSAPTTDFDPTTPHVDELDPNDADFRGIEILTVDPLPRSNSNAGSTLSQRSNATTTKHAFIPRHFLKPPSSLSIVQQEFERGELDQDLVYLRGKALKKGSQNDTTAGLSQQQPQQPDQQQHDVELCETSSQHSGGGHSTSSGGDINNTGGSNSNSNGYARSNQWLDQFRDLLRSGKKLDQFRATAISGNDTLSSVLYMTGSVVLIAGIWAPIGPLFIAVLLYFFRNVYSTSEALCQDGGCYNVLLNSTKKGIASIAAVLTILSYIATAVVSGSEAVHYIHSVFDFPKKWITLCVIGVLLLFAILSWIGIGESSTVALIIFGFHLLSLITLIIFSIVRLAMWGNRWDIILQNWDFQPQLQPNYGKAIYYGFASAALGCSGYESTSNFISQQRPMVFRQTLRNMWVLSSIFNICLPLCVIFHVNIEHAIATKEINTALSVLAFNLGGRILQIVICIDACCVLCGGVLTSYVGVTGLVTRLALDRVIPDWFLMQNKMRGTYHFTIFGFFVLTSTMYVVLQGDSRSLSSTYSIAFLVVMGLFAVGAMMMKVSRSTLVLAVKLMWHPAIIGLIGCILALAGIVANDPSIVLPFVIYFLISIFLLSIMLFRVTLLGALVFVLENTFGACCCKAWCGSHTSDKSSVDIVRDGSDGNIKKQQQVHNTIAVIEQGEVIPGENAQKDAQNTSSPAVNENDGVWTKKLCQYREGILDTPMAFLTRCGEPNILNKAILYIKTNEDCCWVRILHFYQDEQDIPEDLDRTVRMLNVIYPTIRIDLVLIHAPFNPTTFAYTSVKLNIPRNFMFISTPRAGFKWSLASLGGCRVIAR